MRFIINMHQCFIMHVALFLSSGETVRRYDSGSPLVSPRSFSKNASRILVYTPRKPSAALPRRYSDRALVSKTTGPQSLKPSDYIVQQGISYQTLQDICCIPLLLTPTSAKRSQTGSTKPISSRGPDPNLRSRASALMPHFQKFTYAWLLDAKRADFGKALADRKYEADIQSWP